MSEEDDLRLRDQFALAAMQTLLEKHNPFKTFIDKDEPDWGGETKEQYFKRLDRKVERIAIMSYRIADEMRKARLASFK